MAEQQPRPTEIRLRKRSRILEIAFDDGQRFELSCEYLRVFSPSAEVRGHGPGQEVLQVGKQDVAIVSVDPVGNYAVRLVFDDGHDSGIYSWPVLYDLGINRDANWQLYRQRLRDASVRRDDPEGHC